MSAVTSSAFTTMSSGHFRAARAAGSSRAARARSKLRSASPTSSATQETYLSDFAKSSRFPNPLPEIKLDDLAVVAFVQDDDDQSIIGAVSVPVKPINP